MSDTRQEVSARITVGIDLGDRYSDFCFLDAAGTVVDDGRLRTTATALRHCFTGRSLMLVVIEVGTHSPWVSRLLEECGHEVIVANARKVRLIYANDNKTPTRLTLNHWLDLAAWIPSSSLRSATVALTFRLSSRPSDHVSV